MYLYYFILLQYIVRNKSRFATQAGWSFVLLVRLPEKQPSRSVVLFCIYGRDPVIRSKCCIAILAGNVLIIAC